MAEIEDWLRDELAKIRAERDAALKDRERLRKLLVLAEIEDEAWRRLVYDNCGCIPEYPTIRHGLPDDFAEQWRALERRYD